MTEMRRPASVWIAQIIILLAGVPITLVVLITFLRDLVALSSANLAAVQWIWVPVSIVLRIGFALLFFYAFWGLTRRRNYGRWLGVACISLIVLFSIFGQVFRPKGPMEYYEYTNSTQWMGGMFASLIIYGLFAFLLYRLAFGENVHDFFLSSREADLPLEPPPPDSFFQEPTS